MNNSFEEVMRFAINKEEEAVAFYEMAAVMARDPMKPVFKELANVERGHKQMLENWSRKGTIEPTGEEIADLRISNYLVEVPVGPDMSYQDVLIVAMKREEKAFELYTNMATFSEDAESRQFFEALAQEESKHKLRLETEYDEVILSEA